MNVICGYINCYNTHTCYPGRITFYTFLIQFYDKISHIQTKREIFCTFADKKKIIQAKLCQLKQILSLKSHFVFPIYVDFASTRNYKDYLNWIRKKETTK